MNISQVTVEILLAWMGVRKAGTESIKLPARLCRHNDSADILSVKGDRDEPAKKYFDTKKRQGLLQASFTKLNLSTGVLDAYLPKKRSPLQDFATMYARSAAYRNVVVWQLRDIIERDVSAMSLNPVFGSLWRALCNDRENDHRQDSLVARSKVCGIVMKRPG